VIETVEINNFRGLRKVKVRLSPLTVLIGPNNSGKTSFLRAIEVAGTGPSTGFKIELADHWRMNLNNSVAMRIGSRSVQVSGSHAGQGIYRSEVQEGSDFAPVAFFRLPYDVKMTANGFTDAANGTGLGLGSSGENVAAMVDFMLRRARDRFDAMEAEARELIPGLQSLRVATPNAQTRRLDLVMEGGCEMPPTTLLPASACYCSS